VSKKPPTRHPEGADPRLVNRQQSLRNYALGFALVDGYGDFLHYHALNIALDNLSATVNFKNKWLVNAHMTVYINPSPGKGLGVFAAKDFKKGELIESCPVLVLTKEDHDNIDKTALLNYYFLWGENLDQYAICWGYGSIYNHSHTPNAEFDRDPKNNHIIFKALRDIKKGEEIFTDYEWDIDEKTPEWFKKRH
jgi:uncharacterized protein